MCSFEIKTPTHWAWSAAAWWLRHMCFHPVVFLEHLSHIELPFPREKKSRCFSQFFFILRIWKLPKSEISLSREMYLHVLISNLRSIRQRPECYFWSFFPVSQATFGNSTPPNTVRLTGSKRCTIHHQKRRYACKTCALWKGHYTNYATSDRGIRSLGFFIVFHFQFIIQKSPYH